MPNPYQICDLLKGKSLAISKIYSIYLIHKNYIIDDIYTDLTITTQSVMSQLTDKTVGICV